MGACKASVIPFVNMILIVMQCEMLVPSQLGSSFLTSRGLGALRRHVPVPNQASAVAGMPGRDAVVKAGR